jgi:deoxyhypusine synthase
MNLCTKCFYQAEEYEIDLKDSWMYAAAEKKLNNLSRMMEDSTMGNIFCSYVIKEISTVKSGIEYMTFLADWYPKNSLMELGFPNWWWYSRRF